MTISNQITCVITCRDGIPCRLSLYIIKNAAVRRSMRRCLIAQSRSMSKTPRPPSCAYPLSGLIAVRPPYKNTLRSQKSVPIHSTLKKCYAARSIMYIRPMVISFLKAWRSQLTFGFEKGRQAGSLSRPRARFFVRDEIPYFCKQPAVSL